MKHHRSFLRTQTPADELTVRRGQVACPLRGKIDVEICFYCPFIREIDMDGKPPMISCTPPTLVSEEDRVAYDRLTILEFARLIGNVSKACRISGITRRQFYAWKKRYDAKGMQGLRPKTQNELKSALAKKAKFQLDHISHQPITCP